MVFLRPFIWNRRVIIFRDYFRYFKNLFYGCLLKYSFAFLLISLVHQPLLRSHSHELVGPTKLLIGVRRVFDGSLFWTCQLRNLSEWHFVDMSQIYSFNASLMRLRVVKPLCRFTIWNIVNSELDRLRLFSYLFTLRM